jgi:hypothetical protein
VGWGHKESEGRTVRGRNVKIKLKKEGTMRVIVRGRSDRGDRRRKARKSRIIGGSSDGVRLREERKKGRNRTRKE